MKFKELAYGAFVFSRLSRLQQLVAELNRSVDFSTSQYLRG